MKFEIIGEISNIKIFSVGSGEEYIIDTHVLKYEFGYDKLTKTTKRDNDNASSQKNTNINH